MSAYNIRSFHLPVYLPPWHPDFDDTDDGPDGYDLVWVVTPLGEPERWLAGPYDIYEEAEDYITRLGSEE